MHRVDEVGERIRVRLYPEMLKRRILVDVHLVGPAGKQLFDRLSSLGSYDDGLDGVVDLRGKLARLAEELEPHGMESAVRRDLGDDGDAAPLRLVYAGLGVVHELERPAALPDAQTAHAAARADLKFACAVLAYRPERTERLRRIAVGYLRLVYLYV